MTSTDETEPKGSGGSSPDEACTCGHPRERHPALTRGYCTGEVITPEGDDRSNCPCRAFVLAGPDAPCAQPADCRYLFMIDCEYGCRAAADELTRLRLEADGETT